MLENQLIAMNVEREIAFGPDSMFNLISFNTKSCAWSYLKLKSSNLIKFKVKTFIVSYDKYF